MAIALLSLGCLFSLAIAASVQGVQGTAMAIALLSLGCLFSLAIAASVQGVQGTAMAIALLSLGCLFSLAIAARSVADGVQEGCRSSPRRRALPAPALQDLASLKVELPELDFGQFG